MSTAKQHHLPTVMALVVVVSAMALSCEGKNIMQGAQPTNELNLGAAVKTIECSHDGALIAAGLETGEIVLVDVKTWKITSKFEVATDVVTAISFSPDDKLLACGTESDTVSVYDVKTAKLVRDIKEPNQQSVGTIQFSPDGKQLCLGTRDGVVRLVSTATWTATSRYNEADARLISPDSVPNVYQTTFLPDSRAVAVGLRNGVLLLSTNGLTEQKGFPNTARASVSIAFSPNGKLMAVASDSAQVWKVEGQGEARSIPKEFQGSVCSVDFSYDGNFVLVGYARGPRQQNFVQVYSLELNKTANHFSCHKDTLARACFIPKSHRIVTASFDGTIATWSVNIEEPK